MISLKNIQTGKVRRSPRILIHGIGGVGKTTFAAQSDRPIFLLSEDGLGVLDVPHFPLLTNFQDVLGALDALRNEDHDYKTVVMDSLDWLETLIWQHLMRTKNWRSIEEQPYGAGYAAALELWKSYVTRMNVLNTDRNMVTIQIAHTEIKRFDSPEHPPYDRYVIKLNGKASALNQENSDIVAFANYKTEPMEDQLGGKERRAANRERKKMKRTGTGERVMHLHERPAFIAKNRYGLPDELPLSWKSLINAIKAEWTKIDKKNVNGDARAVEGMKTENSSGENAIEGVNESLVKIDNGSGENEERTRNVS